MMGFGGIFLLSTSPFFIQNNKVFFRHTLYNGISITLLVWIVINDTIIKIH